MRRELLFAMELLFLSTLTVQADEFIGIIKPINDVKISVPLDGIVQSIYVKEGNYVKKGQKILKLENSLQQLELNRRKIIWKDKAQLNAVVKNREIQEELFVSTKRLYEESRAVSQQELQLLESKLYMLEGEVHMRRENKKKEKVEYDIAKQLLSKYLIRSPINGIIIEMGLQKGEWAKAGKPFVRIVNTYTCYVDINIDEAYSSKLKVGDKINFTVMTKSISAKKKGKVIFISPVADMASGLVRIKIKFSNRKNRITPGLSATINIEKFSKNKTKESL